jgi:hypothetical protein
MAEEPDEREKWAQGCLAKANYCEFASGVANDGTYRGWLKKLAAEWKEAARQPPKELIANQSK